MKNSQIIIENILKNNHALLCGNCLDILKDMPNESIDCAITSPPYWKQREYQHENGSDYEAIGDEKDPNGYVKNLSDIFIEVQRVLKPQGSFWLNLGDKFYNKNLMGMPWRVALRMQEQGWILRSDIIWDQMKGTQSAKDRMRDVYEHVFHFVKSHTYYFADKEIRIKPKLLPKMNGNVMVSATGVSGKKYFEQIETSTALSNIEKKNARNALEQTIEEMKSGLVVDFRMTIRGNQRTYHSDNKNVSGRAKELETKGYFFLKMKASGYLPSDIWRIVPEDEWRKDAHYAVFPEELLIVPIKSTCPIGGIVLDPFSGIGSTVSAAIKHGRNGIGIELSKSYNEIAKKRVASTLQNTPSLLPLL